MKKYPDTINTVDELSKVLSQPSDALVEFMRGLEGDIMILGAGGKIGPSMARRAKRAIAEAGVEKNVIAVDLALLPELEALGIKTISCDMLKLDEVEKLPKVKNIIYMVGRKFGSTGSEHLTWGINVIVAYHVARTFVDSRIVAFSTGCVYPVMDIYTGGATEETPAGPIGEYSMSSLGRERMFDFFSKTVGQKVLQLRLNYALELRYGVLVDVATKVFNGRPVDVTTGFANGIWQGDACDQVLRCLEHTSSPAAIMNITGPEIFSIRQVAVTFGKRFGKEPVITGEENGKGYLSNATKANAIFGNPDVPLGKVIDWIVHWIMIGGENSGKETHFETQNGKY